MFLDSIKATGELTVQMFNGDTGELYMQSEEKNLVVSVGTAWIASRLKDVGIPPQMSHMEVGQSSTATSSSQTDVISPFTPRARVSLQVAGGTVVNNTVTYTATFPAGVGTGAINEAVIVNASSGGTVLCRTVFGTYNKPANDSMIISWTVTING